MQSENFRITDKVKGKLGSLPFLNIKEEVLGKDYDLSLVFVDSKESHELNKKYRQKDKPTDILSFPLSDNSGEIYIDLIESAKQAPQFGREFENFIVFLFIHGLLHLKGMNHGSTMEKAEAKIRSLFGI